MFALGSFGPMAVSRFGLPSTAILWIGSSLFCSSAVLIGEDYKVKQTRVDGQRSNHMLGGGYVGSSGSMLGIVAAIACAFPKQKIWIFPIPLPLPMRAALGLFGIGSAVAYFQNLVPLLSHTGHLGGMAFGVLYYLLSLKRQLRVPRL